MPVGSLVLAHADVALEDVQGNRRILAPGRVGELEDVRPPSELIEERAQLLQERPTRGRPFEGDRQRCGVPGFEDLAELSAREDRFTQSPEAAARVQGAGWVPLEGVVGLGRILR